MRLDCSTCLIPAALGSACNRNHIYSFAEELTPEILDSSKTTVSPFTAGFFTNPECQVTKGGDQARLLGGGAWLPLCSGVSVSKGRD